MAYIAFTFFILAPLAILGINLGRDAMSLRRRANAGAPRRKMHWPVRARATFEKAPRTFSVRMPARRRRSKGPAEPVVERTVAAAPQPAAAAPAPVALPVTASTYGFVPAPASAFEAAPALTPRRPAETVQYA